MTERKSRKKSGKPAGAGLLTTAGIGTTTRPGQGVPAAGPFSRTTLRARLALLTLGVRPTRVSQP
jgi:hypothetical protein